MLKNKKLLPNSAERSVIGIDIGTSSLKAVELAHIDKSSRLVAYGEYPCDTKADPEILSNNIHDLLEKPILGSFKSANINISFPRYLAHNHFVTIDIRSDTNKEEATRQFIVNKLGLNPSDFYFDYQTISTKKDDNGWHQILMIDVINRKLFDEFNKNLNNKLRINSIVPTFAKQLSSVISNDSESIVFIDIGHDITKMFFCNQTNCIEKRINLGGANVTQKIADNFGLNYQRALELQKNIGLLGSDLASKIKSQIVNEINYLAQEIREFVEECIDIFNIETSSDISIYITGSIMSTKGINQLLNKLTRYNLNIVDPWKDVGIYPLKPIPKHRLPKYAGAISLAI